jgi:hypothetical protein
MRMRGLGSVAALLALATIVASGVASGAGVLPTIYISYVGTNCTFTMVNDAGSSFTSIAPGTYQLILSAEDFVSCPNALPNFQLSGPGVLVNTPIDNGTGAAADYTVTFQPSGTYIAQDLNQPASKLTFTTQASGSAGTVTAPTSTAPAAKPTVGTDTPTKTTTPSTPKTTAIADRGTLEGIVSATGRLSLTFDGKPVTELTAGRYKVAVDDKSRQDGFTIQQVSKLPTTITGVSFIGKRSATLVLSAGQSLFYPSFDGKKTYFLVVAAQ